VWYEAMMEFSIESCLRFGWETFKRRPWFFVGSGLAILLIYFVASLITGGLNAAFAEAPDKPTVISSVIDGILGILISMGVAAFYLNAHDNPETVSLASLWHPRPFLKYLGAAILAGLAIAVGFVLLIVPGIIFSIMFMFTTLIVIDREAGPIVAMKESKRITYGYKWPLLGFVLVLALINLLGLLAVVVGLLVSIPVTTLAFVHAYRVLSNRAPTAPAA
jgi:uncharacterized membrane protein